MRSLRPSPSATSAAATSSADNLIGGEKRASPEDTASFFSNLYFAWLTPLLRLGRDRPLEADDLFPSSAADRTAATHGRFDPEWERSKAEAAEAGGGATPSLWRTFWRIHRGEYFAGAVMYAAYVCTLLVGPMLVRELVRWAEDWRAGEEDSAWRGYRVGVLLFVNMVVGSLGQSHGLHRTTRALTRVRTALIAAIFRKSMRLSNAARREVSAGEVINLVASDAQRVVEFAPGLQFAWSSPTILVGGITLLALEVGAGPALAGFFAMLLFMPMAKKLTGRQIRYQNEMLKHTDARVGATKEVLQAIRVVKLYSWEEPFSGTLSELRERELLGLRNFIYLKAVTFSTLLLTPSVGAFVTFLTFSASGGDMTASTVFSAIALIQVIRFPFLFLPLSISNIVQMYVSFSRIARFLLLPELGEGHVDKLDEPGVRIEGADFGWDDTAAAPPADHAKAGDVDAKEDEEAAPSPSPAPPILRDVSLSVRGGELVAVCGAVASGKSTLLSGILGENTLSRGSCSLGGRVAYVPQSAFIVHASLRDNILFGLPMDAGRYARVVRACQLQSDLDMLPDGDETFIGERGLTLSGGQKQRVSCARAAYQVLSGEAEVVLLDDPLSALDAHVGKQLFEQCVLGIMGGTCRVLVTHSLQYLPQTDRVVVLRPGARGDGSHSVAADGPFAELNANGSIAEMMAAFNSGQQQQQQQHAATGDADDGDADGPARRSSTSRAGGSAGASAAAGKAGKDQAPSLLVQKEEMERGTVDGSVYRAYYYAAGKPFVALCAAALVLAYLALLSGDLWLSVWTSDVDDGDERSVGFYMGVYLALIVFFCVCVLGRSLLLARLGLRASLELSRGLLRSVMRNSVRFFDTTPVGRILNRFSADLGLIDTRSGSLSEHTGATLVSLVLTAVLICVVAPPVLLIFLVLTPILYGIQRDYRRSSREMQRIENVTRTPIYSHLGEALNGSTAIRALGPRVRTQYERGIETRADGNQSSLWYLRVSGFWLRLRLDVAGGVVVAATAVSLVASFDVFDRSLSAGLVGLVITYTLQITANLNWFIILGTQLEASMSSVERVLHYSRDDDHEAWGAADPAADRAAREGGWPSRGAVEVKSLSARYAPGLDLVLRDVSFSVPAGARVGVCGRTGSGKSSLMNALFRTLDVAGGRVEVDGVDTALLSLHTLRSRIAFVPQDPVVFAGSLRFNLDPFGKHTDEEVWAALELVRLDEQARRLPAQLEERIEEEGENFSQGSRQLLCMARAVLARPRILALDEATASVDHETDEVIQQLLRDRFAGCTLITIAHRLATILDYDLILVLDAGRVVQFGPPDELRADTSGALHAMLRGEKHVEKEEEGEEGEEGVGGKKKNV